MRETEGMKTQRGYLWESVMLVVWLVLAVAALSYVLMSTAHATARGAATNRQYSAQFQMTGNGPGPVYAEQRPGNCTDTNVALYENFEETSGNMTVPTGCAASGTVLTANGTPTYQVTTGVPPGLGKAISFNGSTDRFISAGDVQSLDPGTSDMTIEMWIKRTDAGGTNPNIVSKRTVGGAGWNLFFSAAAGDGLALDLGSTGLHRFNFTSTCSKITDGAWHNFRLAIARATTATLYVDGVLCSAATLDADSKLNIDTAQPVEIGNVANGASSYFQGSLADLRITIGNSTNNLGYNDGSIASGNFTSGTLAPTFTRATVSTRYNPATQLLESVASGVPVLGAPIGTSGSALPAPGKSTGLYVGAATTFLFVNNQASNEPNACVTNTTNTSDVTAPDGTHTAMKTVESACGSNAGFNVHTALAVTANQSNTFTAWMRGASGGEVSRIYNGTFTQDFTLTTSWQRFVLTHTFSDSSTTETAGLVADGTHNGTIYSWNPEYYQKAFPVPLDPAVTASAVTVNADAVSYTSSFDTTVMTLTGWIRDATDTTLADITGSGTGLQLIYSFNGRTQTEIYTGSTGIFGAPGTANAWHHTAFAIQSGTQHAYLDGAVLGSVPTIAYTAAVQTTLTVGKSSSTAYGSAFIRAISFFPSVLTSTDISTLYTAQNAGISLRDTVHHAMLAALDGRGLFDLLSSILPHRDEARHAFYLKHYLPRPAFFAPLTAAWGTDALTGDAVPEDWATGNWEDPAYCAKVRDRANPHDFVSVNAP